MRIARFATNPAGPHAASVGKWSECGRAEDRAPLSWTNERADTLFVCE
jgi:hypothetical protein